METSRFVPRRRAMESAHRSAFNGGSALMDEASPTTNRGQIYLVLRTAKVVWSFGRFEFCGSISGSTAVRWPLLWPISLSPSMTTGVNFLLRSDSKRSLSSGGASCRRCSSRSKIRSYSRHLQLILSKPWSQHLRLPSLASGSFFPPQSGDEKVTFSDLGQILDLGQEWAFENFGLWMISGSFLFAGGFSVKSMFGLMSIQPVIHNQSLIYLPAWMFYWANVASPLRMLTNKLASWAKAASPFRKLAQWVASWANPFGPILRLAIGHYLWATNKIQTCLPFGPSFGLDQDSNLPQTEKKLNCWTTNVLSLDQFIPQLNLPMMIEMFLDHLWVLIPQIASLSFREGSTLKATFKKAIYLDFSSLQSTSDSIKCLDQITAHLSHRKPGGFRYDIHALLSLCLLSWVQTVLLFSFMYFKFLLNQILRESVLDKNFYVH